VSTMIVFFFLLWIILNGRVTTELVLLGVVIAAVVFVFAKKVFGYSLRLELSIWRNLPWAVLYFLNLIFEIVKAAFQVAAIVVDPKKKPDPVIVEFDSGFHTMFQNAVLGNSITLTPGTITVEQNGEHFRVHCLRPELGEGLDSSSFVKLLGRIKVQQRARRQETDFAAKQRK